MKSYEERMRDERDEAIADLERQVAALTTERDEAVSAVQRLREGQPFDQVVAADIVRRGMEQLAASQAREKKLRDGLHRIIGCHVDQGESMQHHALNALATPADDTALQSRLKGEREKVIALYSPDDTAQDWIDKIRSMT